MCLIDMSPSKIYLQKLLKLCKNNPESRPDIKESNARAIRYLLGRVGRNKRTTEEELVSALQLKSPRTNCVLVTQFHGHKLLKSNRKVSLAVLYCKLWRWPNLKSQHNLITLECCRNFQYELSSLSPHKPQCQCVNPYHYELSKPIQNHEFRVPLIPPDISSSLDDSDPKPGTRALPGPKIFQFNPIGDIVRDLIMMNPAPDGNQL